jgi:hypothetical protein
MGLVKYLLALLLILIPATSFADTHNASSCAREVVNTVITTDATAGDTVVIPVCEGTDGTWTSGITVSKKLYIIGTSQTGTVITYNNGVIFNLGATDSQVSNLTTSGKIKVTGGTETRIHHVTFSSTGSNREAIWFASNSAAANQLSALVDHCEFNNARILIEGIYGTGNYKVSNVWDNDLNLGSTDQYVYIEDNVFDYVTDNACIEAQHGGSYVARYNTATDCYFNTHGQQDLMYRGTRKWEFYRNTFVGTESAWRYPIRGRSGTGVAFDNTVSGTWGGGTAILLDEPRASASTNPNGICNGANDVDGNEDAYGYPCRDQVGTGGDVSLWTALNEHPAQTKTPAYAWSNTANFLVYGAASANVIVANRDFFNGTAGFDGTAGVGVGLLAARPETCTAGVAYWATDQGTWNTKEGEDQGVLYKCTSKNTWEVYYTPYTYPHPLREDAGTDETAPTLVSATIAANGTSLSLVFTEAVTVNTNTGFVLTATGSPSLTYASGTGTTTLVYTIGAAVQQSESGITLAYTTGANYIEDAAGNDLGSFTGTAVVNNSTQNTPPTVELTVTKTGSGCTVTSAPSGVNCGSTCTLSVDNGTAVTLSGWSENGWNAITYGGDCAANGTVTMNAAKECTATCTQVQLFP